jgi:hypothetical protein
MLYALAVCDPIRTTSGDVMIPEEFRTLGDRTARGEITMVVLPWPDPALEHACGGASRVIRAWDWR